MEVAAYLEREGVVHGELGQWPAWHIAPIAALWAIESKKSPGRVGWWTISGDLPCDYVSASKLKHPRDALRAIAESWLAQSELMARGETDPEISLGRPKSGHRSRLCSGRAHLRCLRSRRTMTFGWKRISERKVQSESRAVRSTCESTPPVNLSHPPSFALPSAARSRRCGSHGSRPLQTFLRLLRCDCNGRLPTTAFRISYRCS